MEYVPLAERTLRNIMKDLHAVRLDGRGKVLGKNSELDTWLKEHNENERGIDLYGKWIPPAGQAVMEFSIPLPVCCRNECGKVRKSPENAGRKQLNPMKSRIW